MRYPLYVSAVLEGIKSVSVGYHTQSIAAIQIVQSTEVCHTEGKMGQLISVRLVFKRTNASSGYC